jgi:hypothetical protein
MSARPAPRPDAESPTAVIEAASADMSLAEGQSYCVASPDNPLRRNIAVSIKATLDDLVNKSSKATWAPSSSALKSAFQQKKFTSLEGSVDAQGDLKARCTAAPPFAFCASLLSGVCPSLPVDRAS